MARLSLTPGQRVAGACSTLNSGTSKQARTIPHYNFHLGQVSTIQILMELINCWSWRLLESLSFDIIHTTFQSWIGLREDTQDVIRPGIRVIDTAMTGRAGWFVVLSLRMVAFWLGVRSDCLFGNFWEQKTMKIKASERLRGHNVRWRRIMMEEDARWESKCDETWWNWLAGDWHVVWKRDVFWMVRVWWLWEMMKFSGVKVSIYSIGFGLWIVEYVPKKNPQFCTALNSESTVQLT